MSESGAALSHSVLLLDTANYPRQFSLSLLCSILLHAAAATVLFHEVRFPSIDTVRDVFLTPDWEEPVVVTPPRAAGGGARTLPLQSSPAPPRAVRPAPVPAPATPKALAQSTDPAERRPAATPAPPTPAAPSAAPPAVRASQSSATSALEPEGVAPLPPATVAPEPPPAPALRELPSVGTAPVVPPAPAAVVAPRAPVAPPAPAAAPVAPPSPVVASAPAVPVHPELPPASVLAPSPRIEEPPPAPRAAPATLVPPPPAVTAPEQGPAQAPAPVARQPIVEERPPSLPSEWRNAQPLVAAPALPPVPPVDAPAAPPAPALGLPAPPAPPPTLAATVPPAPVPAPLDWEVPAAPERDRSSVGRSNEGATQPVIPAAPAQPLASAPIQVSPAPRPTTGPVEQRSRGASDRATAPEPGLVPPVASGLGTASTFSSSALLAQRTAERAAIPAGQGTAETKAAPAAGAVGSGPGLDTTPTVRTAPAIGAAPVGAGAPADTPAPTGGAVPAGVASGAPSGVAAAGAPAAPSAVGPFGGVVAGAPAGPFAGGAPSGTDTRGTAPGGAGTGMETGVTSGPVTSETGTGSGGQAIAQGGAGRASQDGVGKGTVGGVAITTPLNGHTLSPDEPPIVIVRGNVQNVDVDAITLLVNKRRIEVPVRDGKFQYPVVVVDPITKISAEIPKSDARRSESVTVNAAPNSPTTAVILLDWGEAKPTGGVDMSALWRARADRADETQMKLFVRTATLPEDIPFSAFYLRNMQAGVYTFLLGYRGIGGGTPVVPKFFLTNPGVPTAREMKTISLAGTGRTVSVRVLLPQAVLWDQDEWFTGRSEASDTITKFRDDGTTWIERKGLPVGR